MIQSEVEKAAVAHIAELQREGVLPRLTSGRARAVGSVLGALLGAADAWSGRPGGHTVGQVSHLLTSTVGQQGVEALVRGDAGGVVLGLAGTLLDKGQREALRRLEQGYRKRK